MTDEMNKPSDTPTIVQLADTLRASEPSSVRDLAIHLLETGQVNADSTLAELGEVVKEYYATQQ